MIRFCLAAGLFFWTLTVAAQTYVVPSELWDRPRTARMILDNSAIRQAVAAGLARPGARIVVHHGATQDSLLAAEELRSWLGALALESSRMILRGDLQPSEPLRIEVIRE